MPASEAPRILPGRPYPLGASWDGRGVNFALFSDNAERVELCLFDASGNKEAGRVTLPDQTDGVWHGYLPDGRPNMLYGYRVHGPYEPTKGHRFNPNKLLIDPYARALHGQFRWTDAHMGYRIGSSRADLSFDRRDNARFIPKARVVEPAFTWGDDRRPVVPWSDTVVYETHVRGFTIRNPEVAKALRGTFAGLGEPEMVAYLKALGVTTVELLPVHAFLDDRFLLNKGLKNYWGYNTLGFFAPEPRYMSQTHLTEFKTMVKRFHNSGIEVLLDVVYNHTCEGSELGPTLSFRGIDNASYYVLNADEPRFYVNHTGTGNALNLSHPRVLQMVTDSLRYWVTEMHVDGFRFDLASTLGREPTGFDPGSGFFDSVRQDPILNRVKLIAEPWDIGPGGYQVGNYPAGWAEWNDRYRDTIRRFWKGDHGMLPDLAGRLTGSSDLFEHNGRKPYASINFVACHDGFTLADLVRYEQKHNEANGEDGQDGHDDNNSANYGVEGPTDDPDIRETRVRQQRNMLATVLLSQGTPMICAGDERGRTQQGNNNAYCQDNPLSWLDWESDDPEGRALHDFTRRVIALRQAHPAFRRPRFLHGRAESPSGMKDILWITPEGQPKTEEQWKDHFARCIGLVLAGDAGDFIGEDGRPLKDDVLLLILNAHTEAMDFSLPAPEGGKGWSCLLDTARPELKEDEETAEPGAAHPVPPQSLLLFALMREPAA